MAVLFRVLLFGLLIYLIVKMIREFMAPPRQDDSKMSSPGSERKVSKDVGEYVDYEEIDKGKRTTTKDEGHTGDRTSQSSDKSKNTRDFR